MRVKLGSLEFVKITDSQSPVVIRMSDVRTIAPNIVKFVGPSRTVVLHFERAGFRIIARS